MLEIPLRLLCRGWTRPKGLRMRTGKLGRGSGSRKRSKGKWRGRVVVRLRESRVKDDS